VTIFTSFIAIASKQLPLLHSFTYKAVISKDHLRIVQGINEFDNGIIY